MKKLRLVATAVALGFTLAALPGASGVPEMTLGEVLRDSKAVIHGVVVDQFSQWEEGDGNKIIFTYSTLRVQHADFGKFAPARDVVVRTVGGLVDGYRQLLIDEASFTMGEEVVVFLDLEDGWLHPSVVGFHQGKYTVTRDAAGHVQGLRRDAGQQVDSDRQAKQPLIPLARFASDLRRARLGLAQGDTSDVHPLVKIR